ncbi:MAG: M15 family metallopeptidase [Lachnospiraceae bacterium]|nr:M15 family metallopeptidase [Lachnospiraceae bacterium]
MDGQKNKKKYHFFRKIIAIIFTVLAFSLTASFSTSATATVMDTDVIFVNDDGNRTAVDKSEIFKENESAEEVVREDLSLEDEELDRIAETSKKAAEDFNKRNADNASKTQGITIVDSDGKTEVPSFDKDWSLMLINKDHRIPDDYTFELATISGSVKSDVRVAEYLVEMLKAARDDGINMFVASPYRDLERQTYVFNRKVKSYTDQGYDYNKAYELASETVAIPGTSEHQVGLAFDLVTTDHLELDAEFADTDGGRWLAEQGPEYGFILRYPKGAESITGIEFEPWHYRYVGVEAAKEITRLGVTLEEYDEMIGLVEPNE